MILQFVSPTCYSHIYSEKLVHLPHCYFVNDYKQVRAPCYLFFCPSHSYHLWFWHLKSLSARKIVIVLILYAHIKDQIMGYPRISSSLHALISFIRWIQKYLIHGNGTVYIFLSFFCSVYDSCRSSDGPEFVMGLWVIWLIFIPYL